jgi:HD-GYP domain-containing protein (c-di-GMP phosphodiesterase class II)
MIANHVKLARSLAEELGLSRAVVDALGAVYEQWDGHGWPRGLAGLEIPFPARIAALAEFIEVAHRVGGIARAREFSAARRGSQFDPRLVDTLRAHEERVLGGLDAVSAWDAVIESEPRLRVVLSETQFDDALLAIGNFVDLKSPYTLGHAPAVAELAAAAGSQLGMDAHEVHQLRSAGLLHGVGRLGISNAIWDKQGPLGVGEWERVRMQPYISERMLQQSRALSTIAAIVVQHRERLDGSGYPRHLSGAAITRQGRTLAVADAYQAMREPRAYRTALAPGDAARALRSEVNLGRLDADAVEAVLRAAGHRVS